MASVLYQIYKVQIIMELENLSYLSPDLWCEKRVNICELEIQTENPWVYLS